VPVYQVKVCDTRTGAVLDDLPFSGFTLSASVDWARHDSLSVAVPLLGVDARRELVTGLAYEPWKRALCLVRDGRAVWAGPVMTAGWDHTGLTLGCGGLTQLLARRFIFLEPTHTTTLTSSARDAVIMLMNSAVDDVAANSAYSLPLVVGAPDGAGPYTERSWRGRDVPTVYDAVKKLVDEENAADVRVDAGLDANQAFLTWTVAYGTPYLGRVDPVVAWDFPATVQSWTGDLDGSAMLSRGYVLGDGQDEDRLIADAVNDLPDQGWPMLEAADRTTVSTRDPAVLAALAQSYAATGATVAAAHTLEVDPAYPDLSTWAPGDNAVFRSAGHWFLPDAERVRRVTGYNLTESSLKLETMAPLGPYVEAAR
jgi:hypothetical protein